METSKGLDFLATLLPFAAIIFIIAVGVVLLTQQFNKNLYRQKLKAEELKNLHQVELLRLSIQAQEEERKRIAHDMHDELGAVLSITKMHLQQLEEKAKDTMHELLPALQNIRSLTETSLASMRRISHELMPPQLETFGLVKTLEVVAKQVNNAGAINMHINTADTLSPLSWPADLGLYRICMELVNNTIKHAGAKNITVSFSQSQGDVICTYTDDGKGLTGDSGIDGLGFKSIEGRITSLKGSITYSKIHKGFQAIIKIPFS
jgi:signal transduction histidine kinase